MSPEADALLEIAARVSDGGAIDWDALEADAGDDEERRHFARLRAVAELVAVHDSLWSSAEEIVPAPHRPAVLAPGRVLGDRYRVDGPLGSGGIGEVWQAYDLKLCVDVALKVLRNDARTTRRVEVLRREVRTARRVVSPHVCRIYDLVEIDGLELISMEFVDGTDLGRLLRSEGSMPIRRAREVASQLLSGLQAIHDAGLVHRDLKPSNVMLTPAGRVVVMDFGVAKESNETGSGVIAGTPAYMAPEQARGRTVNARTDVYAAGLVLLELVHPRERDDADDAVRGFSGPWREPLLRALAENPSDRFPTAREFDRALEAASLDSGVKDERSPFPGLAAFTEADAGNFFGRETEVETLGTKLKRLHMVALVGPSGVGKSSLLRAGLLPSLPGDWGRVVCTPGTAPFVALGEALAPQLSGDTDALRALVRFDDLDVVVSLFGRWRSRFDDAVVVLDQFEELFTQNPDDVQTRFATLLGRLPLEADVRVLLSLRDDFLFQCHAHPDLRPILTDLTLLPPLQGPELRRALIHPALACGYRFEDDALVDEIVGEVEQERGALPLLAFTASRLWEHRDRTRGTLPRKAYWVIGGVGGSLARHAEETLDKIGEKRFPVVREMFRALVSGRGTRLSRRRDELLSLSSDRNAAAETLDALVEARLLTAYDSPDPRDPETRRQRVELVHESLLTHWPRLVRWRTQDADGAQFRDQLRQAAQVWDEGGRPADMLWTGSVYQEYRLWRDRFPGQLTNLEEAFASAAREQARRQKRRKTTAIVSAIAVLVAGLAVTVTLWQQSERAQERAEAEARHAEAEKLYTLAQNAGESVNAIPFILAALELSDQPDYRRYAWKVLLRTPIPFRLPPIPDSHNAHAVAISPDGKWLAFGWSAGQYPVQLYPLDGGEPRVLGGHRNRVVAARFDPASTLLATSGLDGKVKIWSIPDGALLRTFEVAETTVPFFLDPARLLTCEGEVGKPPLWTIRPLDGRPARVLGRAGPSPTNGDELTEPDIDPSGRWAVMTRGREVQVYDLENLAMGAVRSLVSDLERLRGVRFGSDGRVIAGFDDKGGVQLWSFEPTNSRPLRRLAAAERPLSVAFDREGSRILTGGYEARLWDLTSPGLAPVPLPQDGWSFRSAFDPRGQWIVTSGVHSRVDAWPLTLPRPLTLDGFDGADIRGIQFVSGGKGLVAESHALGEIRLWPLEGMHVLAPETLFREPGYGLYGLHRSDDGNTLFTPAIDGTRGNGTLVGISLPDRRVRTWEGASYFMAVDGSGQRVVGRREERDRPSVVRVLDTGTGMTIELGTSDESSIAFVRDGRLLTRNADRLSLWRIEAHERETVVKDLEGAGVRLCPDRETILLHEVDGALTFVGLDGSPRRRSPVRVDRRGAQGWAADADCDLLVFGRDNGNVDVVRTKSGQAWTLPLHDGSIASVAIDPLGRWIATADGDSVKLWPIPTEPAIVSLPHDEFLAKLRSFTNLRARKAEGRPGGYAIVGEGLPDWRHPPGW